MYSASDPVTGNGSYTASYTLPTTGTVAGTYTWVVSYSGDGNNNVAHDQGGPAEKTVVSPANPIVATTTIGNVTLGTTDPTLMDLAFLEGGYSETGTITFQLYNPSHSVVSTQTVPVTGNGMYTGSYVLPMSGTVTGTYTWVVSYSGDGNNNVAHDQGGTAEQAVVSAASPILITTTTHNVTLGTTDPTLKDSAYLEGGYFETGTITFKLYNPSNTMVVYTETVPVSGNGTYATLAGYTLPTNVTVTGTYQWVASYAGDGNNNVAHDQGGTAEQTVVSAASPTLVTTAGQKEPSPALSI